MTGASRQSDCQSGGGGLPHNKQMRAAAPVDPSIVQSCWITALNSTTWRFHGRFALRFVPLWDCHLTTGISPQGHDATLSSDHTPA